MPRPLRIHYPGAVYHVVTRGIDGRDVFLDEQDYKTISDYARFIRDQENARFLAFALMPNHFHLLIRILSAPLCRIMQRLLTRYSIYFNKRHDRRGYVFQGRYKAFLCTNDSYYGNLVRYIHQNPLRAGLEMKLGRWPWTGHNELAHGNSSPLLDINESFSFFGDNLNQARERYLALMRESVDSEILTRHSTISPEGESGGIQRVRPTPTLLLETIASSVTQTTRVPKRLIASGSRQRNVVQAKRIFVLNALKNGHPAFAIARFLGCTPSNICRLLQTPR